MKKVVKVNYPKKRPKLKLEDLADVSEPERFSMYQVLLDNLKIANRATFVHRIIYVGEHYFACFEDAKDVFENIINKSNETYHIEKLTGFFLFYPQYFVHMVERFFDTWMHYTAVPPKLLEKLDTGADLALSGRYIYNCIKKIYSLIGNYAEDISATAADTKPFDVKTISSEEESYHGQPRIYASFSYVPSSISTERSESTCVKDYKLFLPEYELLDFILKSTFTMKLEEYYGLYGVVPMRDIYKDRVWPVPHDFIPYDVFEKPYDLITELPKDARRARTPTMSSVCMADSKANVAGSRENLHM